MQSHRADRYRLTRALQPHGRVRNCGIAQAARCQNPAEVGANAALDFRKLGKPSIVASEPSRSRSACQTFRERAAIDRVVPGS